MTGEIDAVVIGAGFAGLYALHRLRGLGLSAVVFEAGVQEGGTWNWNRYPGARCDVESFAYSFSFSPELDQEWNWTERYPSQPEMLRYFKYVVDKFDLRRDIRFSTKVKSAHFDEARGRWDITTDRGDKLSAKYLVTAVGNLSEPKVPDIKGWDSFKGEVYFTARWPHEEVRFDGKRVAVIGTGSSGVQVIPPVAEQADHLTVFQRTPAYSIPARNAPLKPEELDQIKRRYPAFRAEVRDSSYGYVVDIPTKSALEVSAEERNAKYQKGWDEGRLLDILGAYTDMMTNADANETACAFIREKIQEVVKDPETAKALSPTTYPIGTKRPIIDTNYFETYNRDNVTLVDLTKDPIVEIVPTGIKTASGEYDLDAIIFAVGFDAVTGPLLAIDIQGKGGLTLQEKWVNGPRSYLGLSPAGFPNLFTVAGPLSPSARGNVVVNDEQHVDWVMDCINYMETNGFSRIEAEKDAEEKWFEVVQDLANSMLYGRANSWYNGANIPGKPRVFTIYMGGVGRYRKISGDVAEKGYEGFVLS
jgi:cyclohexanone monooxygenase